VCGLVAVTSIICRRIEKQRLTDVALAEHEQGVPVRFCTSVGNAELRRLEAVQRAAPNIEQTSRLDDTRSARAAPTRHALRQRQLQPRFPWRAPHAPGRAEHVSATPYPDDY